MYSVGLYNFYKFHAKRFRISLFILKIRADNALTKKTPCCEGDARTSEISANSSIANMIVIVHLIDDSYDSLCSKIVSRSVILVKSYMRRIEVTHSLFDF